MKKKLVETLQTIGADSEDVAADGISQLLVAGTECRVTCQS